MNKTDKNPICFLPSTWVGNSKPWQWKIVLFSWLECTKPPLSTMICSCSLAKPSLSFLIIKHLFFCHDFGLRAAHRLLKQEEYPMNHESQTCRIVQEVKLKWGLWNSSLGWCPVSKVRHLSFVPKSEVSITLLLGKYRLTKLKLFALFYLDK